MPNANTRYCTTDGNPPNGGRPPPRPAPAPAAARTPNANIRYYTPDGNPPNGGRPPPQPEPTYHLVSSSQSPPQPTYAVPYTLLPAPPAPTFAPSPASAPAPTYQRVPSTGNAPLYTYLYPSEQCTILLYTDGTQPWNAGAHLSSFERFVVPANMTIKETLRKLGCPRGGDGVAEAVCTGWEGGVPKFRKGRAWTMDGEGSGKTLKEAGWLVTPAGEGDGKEMVLGLQCE